MSDSIHDLTAQVRAFCEERDWDQFHGPKDLAIGIITEASELLELFRFLTEDQSQSLLADPIKREQVEDELADVLFFLLRFSQRFNIDVGRALLHKIKKIEEKYPVDKAKGNNRKYTML